jgi:hypothetical protein
MFVQSPADPMRHGWHLTSCIRTGFKYNFYNPFATGLRSRGSSVSIVPDYRLDDRAIGVRSTAGVKDFSPNLCVQTGSEAHPASCTMCNGGPFPGAKRGRGMTLTTHPHLVPRSLMSRSYTPLPPSSCVACSGTALLQV